MAYRNKTFVSFASDDIMYYRLMCAWRKNQHIDFNFHDAHDLNTALDTSHPDTIRRRLRERLSNTKQVILLVSDVTRKVAAQRSRFLYYEVEVIKRLGLPVVCANTNKARTAQTDLLPRVLVDEYTMSVSFQLAIIKFALDDFVDDYDTRKRTRHGPHYYKPMVYKALDL